MKTNQLKNEKIKTINKQLTIKVAFIIIISILLLIPKIMIIGLINDRKNLSEMTKQNVMKDWSNEQIIRGPVLILPFIDEIFDQNKNEPDEILRECYILPKKLNINGEIFPKELKRSIYKTSVYEAILNITGFYVSPDYEELKIKSENILWNKAKVLVSISDLRGINNQISLKLNGQFYNFTPGMGNSDIGSTGITLPLPEINQDIFSSEFNLSINLKGSGSLKFAPVGETTKVSLKSNWSDPEFIGNFLPTERQINNSGFTAYWKILHFNRNYPQAWKNNEFKATNSDFGVNLIYLADHYQKSFRAAKYAILVIVLIFLSFFLNEIISKQRTHPFQYILIGFAILIFYLLLISFSEQLGFNMSYLISSISVLGMILIYSKSFLPKWINSIILTFILTISFTFIYVLMQLESLALLVGSVGLFIILALTMYVTRKINWYSE